MAVEDWTIISAGPSASRVTTDFLLDGPVVAINRSIGEVIPEVGVDVWSCWDDPGRLLLPPEPLGGREPERETPLLDAKCLDGISAVWLGTPTWQRIAAEAMSRVPKEQAERTLEWQRLIPAHVGFRCMSLGFIKDEEGQRAAFGLITACEKAVDLGAKRIRIMGADMVGHTEDVDEPNPDGTRRVWDRWAYERKNLNKMIAAARDVGVEIELAHN